MQRGAKMQKRSFTKEFKLEVVQELSTGKSVGEVSREHDLKPTLVSRWMREHQQSAGLAFSGKEIHPRKIPKLLNSKEKSVNKQWKSTLSKKSMLAYKPWWTNKKKTRRLPKAYFYKINSWIHYGAKPLYYKEKALITEGAKGMI